MKYKVYIDGAEGTTGLKIHQYFQKRGDIELLEIDREQWRKETELIEEHYAKFDRLPEALKKELDDLKARLK